MSDLFAIPYSKVWGYRLSNLPPDGGTHVRPPVRTPCARACMCGMIKRTDRPPSVRPSVRPSDDLGAPEVVDNQHAWQARGRKDGRTAADGEIISPLPYAAAVAIIPRSPARARSQDWQIFITWRQAMRTIRVCTGWTSPSAIATTGLGGCRGGVGTRP